MEIDTEDQLTYGQKMLDCDIYAEDEASLCKMVFAAEIDRLRIIHDASNSKFQRQVCRKAIKEIKSAAETAGRAIAM